MIHVPVKVHWNPTCEGKDSGKNCQKYVLNGKNFSSFLISFKYLTFRIFFRQGTMVMFPESDFYTAEEQMEAEEYMRLTPLYSYDIRNHNSNEMLRLMKITSKPKRFTRVWKILRRP